VFHLIEDPARSNNAAGAASLIAEVAGQAPGSSSGKTLDDLFGSDVAAGLGSVNDTTYQTFTARYNFGQLGNYGGYIKYLRRDGSGNVSIISKKQEVVGGSLILHGPVTDLLSAPSASNIFYFDNGLRGIGISQSSVSLTGGLSGTASLTEYMMLGGQYTGLQLEHANFGYWEARYVASGTNNGVAFNTTASAFQPFVLEGASATKLAPTPGPAFTGIVLANAYDQRDEWNSKSQDLTGTASLNVVGIGSENSITFTLPGFYTLAANNLNITSGGGVSGGNFSVSGTSGINLAGGGTGSVTGQFYGGATATEAVGTFGYSENAGLVGVRGAWGVKRP